MIYKIGINVTYTPSGGSLTQIMKMIYYFSNEKNIELVIYSKKKNNYIFDNQDRIKPKIFLSWLSNTSVLGRVIWEQLFLPFYMIRDGIDVLFCPGDISPIYSPIKKVQWIGTIGPFWEKIYSYKIGILKRIKYPLNKFLMYKSAQNADIVIFESEYTRKLFNNKYGLMNIKSFVMSAGKDKYFHPNSNYNKENRYSAYLPFLLCVSHLYPYKNIPRMIEAFAIAKKNTESDYKMLIAGEKISNKYHSEITNIIKKLKLEDGVILLGAVSKEDLRYLFSSCEFFVFPSPCENFAITLVEAMCCGAPIICANTTAMPETCQEAAIYFGPNNTKEMAEKIELLISDKELRNSLRKKSLDRVKELPYFKDVNYQTFKTIIDLVR